MIDLHTHTDQSDGSLTPARLVEQAVASGLEALAVSDHDTLQGYEMAAPVSREAGLDLVCGIELSTKLCLKHRPKPKTVHLLGYFLDAVPGAEFRAWLDGIQASRRDRNERLAERLQSLGLEITLEEVEAVGRTLTGRPHFAKVLIRKGYVSSVQKAFDLYLDESAKAYVDRHEPSFAEGVEKIRESGGLTVLAHPVRLAHLQQMDSLIGELVEAGLQGIEVYHSEHRPSDVEQFLSLAGHYGLAVTGGSDFHGEAKPEVRLGTGIDGNLSIPKAVLDHLRNSNKR